MNNTVRQQLKTQTRRTAARAFTLVEILIVIALTAVLFALLLIPLVSALRYTQQAQIVTAAQDAARITKERITRELGSAIFVFDGTSHPFQTANKINPGDDKYTNFLDLQILDSTGAPMVAHAYNAKLDFVLPKLNGTGQTIDPTTNEPITYSPTPNGSAIVSNPSYVFPLAAGTTMIRYFVGLKNPEKAFNNNPELSYNNTREGKAVGSDDNTYILYRAQFQPYIPNPNPGPGKPAVVPNPRLFASRNNSSGVAIPELDDPDFFRIVGTTDTNWLDDTHGVYPTQTAIASVTDASADGSAQQHNYRVDKWIQIAKPVIPGPNVDLILLPHKADNTLSYDAGTTGTCTATTCPATAHTGIAHDPVAGGYYPIVNTSVTFRPATISGNATPGTTSDYNSQGSVTVDQAGFTYIPTVYTATSQSWSLPYHVSLYPSNYDSTNAALSMYYDTDQYASSQISVVVPSQVNPVNINPGDIIEYRDDSTGRNPVYDVTQGFPFKLTGASTYSTYTAKDTPQYVPMTINPDNGTIQFSAPSLPNGPSDRFNRLWIYTPDADGLVDLTTSGFTAAGTANPNPSPLTNVTDATSTTLVTGVANAHAVPGSIRVFGPDTIPGPNQGNVVPYTEVNSAVGTIAEDQYSVDYARNTVQVLSGSTGPIQVIYDYQANMTLTAPPTITSGTTPTVDLNSNPYLPMQVKVDYQTRDLIDVTIGVRIYNVTNNRAEVIPAETKIKIGNSNR
ncbi:MAG: PulJ/GspJ family protein [Janthinobacterium lividum]